MRHVVLKIGKCFYGIINLCLLAAFLCGITLNCCAANDLEKPIVVIIPSYNNKEWYKRNLDSVFTQNYQNFRIIYLDDASPDATGSLVEAYIQEKGQGSRVKLIKNAQRIGALGNTHKGAWLCKPHEIIAILDGDDWFPHENVLQKLNSVYADPDVWVTYGQFVYYPCSTPGWAALVSDEVIARNGFRDEAWTTTALRTFYAGLFQKIRKQDLLYEGNFFQMSGDLAYMWPIVEMAGTHSRFIPDVLYVYNVVTPINDVKKDPDKQRDLGFIIREKERYSPVIKPY
jgi:glycosyltransferase involved in cell wall biosynthesis